MNFPDKCKIVDMIIGTCLGFLVETGFVKRELIDGKWYSRHDMDDRLESQSFLAAASIDNIGRPVFIFNIHHSIHAIAWAAAHESIHLAQICKGDWEPCEDYSIWKGQKFKHLKADDPNYFSANHQPWEAEVEKLQNEVRNTMYKKLPVLERL